MPGGIQHNPARRLSAQAREGADYPSLNNHNRVGRHCPVNPKLSDELGQNVRDQPRLVLIGRPFAVPFLFVPSNHEGEIANAR